MLHAFKYSVIIGSLSIFHFIQCMLLLLIMILLTHILLIRFLIYFSSLVLCCPPSSVPFPLLMFIGADLDSQPLSYLLYHLHLLPRLMKHITGILFEFANLLIVRALLLLDVFLQPTNNFLQLFLY